MPPDRARGASRIAEANAASTIEPAGMVRWRFVPCASVQSFSGDARQAGGERIEAHRLADIARQQLIVAGAGRGLRPRAT